MIAVEPKAGLSSEWDATKLGPPSRKIAQLPVSWGTDRDAAVRTSSWSSRRRASPTSH
jgi:hypothetical protein